MRKSDFLDDWYLIERTEHDKRQWMEQIDTNAFALRCSSRISDADIEGSASEMRAIAEAIEKREYVSFKRCAVDAREELVKFWSPRNSQEPGTTSYAEALVLAEQIKLTFGS